MHESIQVDLNKALVISVMVFAIWYTFLPGEIFGRVNVWLSTLNEKLKQPLYQCPVCMVPWHGTYLYWVIPWPHHWVEWIVVVIAAMGLNVIINKSFPNCDD